MDRADKRKSTVFRQSSMQRVSSPEQLNEYIRVLNPGIWLILSAIFILLFAVCIWGVYGVLETKKEAVAIVKDGKAVCYVKAQMVDGIEKDMLVRLDEKEGRIRSIASSPTEITAEFDSYAMYLGEMKEGEWYYSIVLSFQENTVIADGVYTVQIVTESISPLSFVLN